MTRIFSDPDLRIEYTRKSGLVDRGFDFIETLPMSDRFIFKICALIFALSLGWLLYYANAQNLIEIPNRGGTLTEGIVGTPRFVNPVLGVTNADRDLVALLYSGLMKLGPNGVVIPDLAESISVSDDGLTYNVVLKQDAFFHDGTRITSDDVIYTITQVQNTLIKSPYRASWEGVVLERISENELNFVLSLPYAPFIENLTLGILPKHIWEFATAEEFPFSQHNIEPIGSGPYKISHISRNESGIPESYTLVPYEAYYGKIPRISTLKLVFFTNESVLAEAFLIGQINSVSGLAPELVEMIENDKARSDYTLHTMPLPRTFALFFNQNESELFRQKSARNALNASADRKKIVDEVLGGFGIPIEGPIPPGFGVDYATSSSSNTLALLDKARDILRKDGWKINEESGIWEKEIDEETIPLAFSISTGNSVIFQQTAELLKAQWEELGASVTIKQFEQSDLTQSVIRPRKYDAFLFGTVVGRELDFYSFWHSSQRNDPGLNVALYANITTDSILSEARTTGSFADRQKAFARFAEEVSAEVPAVFLYVPTLAYLLPENVKEATFSGIASPSERFSTITDWYIEKESVWPMFAEEDK